MRLDVILIGGAILAIPSVIFAYFIMRSDYHFTGWRRLSFAIVSPILFFFLTGITLYLYSLYNSSVADFNRLGELGFLLIVLPGAMAVAGLGIWLSKIDRTIKAKGRKEPKIVGKPIGTRRQY